MSFSFDPPGGVFILTVEAAGSCFTPEKLSSEARLLAKAASDFMRGEVLPAADRLQKQETGLMRSLLQDAGKLGLLGLQIPERFGGLAVGTSAATRIAEVIAAEPSFSVSHNVHTSVATFPCLFFGAPEQRSRVLPYLATGEWVGAYALSEANAGSDAMAARTRAVRIGSEYSLSGEKMWITNAAFADLFTVFARVDGQEGLTAFLVERDRSGLSIGREEHKLGLKGSSTCRLLLDGVVVPADNRIGEEGEGARIALNTLNLGRFKIAASSVGRSKDILGMAARYAAERKAFGCPIAEFGLVSHKLARMAARIFAAESMLYRLAGSLERAFEGIDATAEDARKKYLAAAGEYAIECAILKVFCTETLDFCADECLQIHGGYGYTEEYPAARAWRDARVNRIYEGTNEINRFNVAQILVRRARSGRLDFRQSATIASAALGAMMRGGENSAPPQEAQGALADIAAELYASQAVLARVAGIGGAQKERAEVARVVWLFESETRRYSSARLLQSVYGEAFDGRPEGQASSLPVAESNVVSASKALARHVVECAGYPF